MTELLLLTTGLLIGIILTYLYMRKKGIDLSELYTDQLVKNRLLKEVIVDAPKTKKPWKKKYYGSKKKTDKPKS